jgi:uncharacterized membrane protein
MPVPHFPLSPPAALQLRVRSVEPGRPLVWLRKGWADLVRCPLPGLLHGLAAALFGLLLVLVAREDFWILAGGFSGFLIVAPILATGLYAVSRRLERGEHPDLSDVLRVWHGRDPRLVHFGLLLALAGTGWVVTSAAMITSFSDKPVYRPLDFLQYVVLHDESWLFEAWLMLGGVLAAPMFASSVVAIPLLLDRKLDLLSAVLTSWRVVLASPATMALWAGLIMLVVTLGMVTALLGLVVAVPWLAHASWHAYRDLVEPEAPPGAQPGSATGGTADGGA